MTKTATLSSIRKGVRDVPVSYDRETASEVIRRERRNVQAGVSKVSVIRAGRHTTLLKSVAGCYLVIQSQS